MPARDIFDDIIAALERQRLAGGNRVRLTEPVARGLFATAGKRDSVSTTQTPPIPSHSDRPAIPQNTGQAVSPRHPRGLTLDAPQPAASEVTSLDWEQLEERVASCTLCSLHRTRTKTVFGEVNRDAQLMFIGEGPGFHEDQSGRPFVGPAGQLLDKMIVAMQFTRQSVYIANVVKCRPPGNRNPNDQEAAACMPYLNRQIELIKPKVLVLLGAVPLMRLLGRTGITQLHGQWFEYRSIPVMPTFHPSYLLRSPARKKEAWEDLQKVMKKLGKDPGETLHKMRSKPKT